MYLNILPMIIFTHITMGVVFYEDSIYFSKSKFQRKYLDEIKTLVYNLNENVVKVSNQNVSDLDPSGQNLDLSGDTLHNDTINIEVDEMEPSGSKCECESKW